MAGKLHARNASLYVWDSTGACRAITGYVNSATLDTSVDTPDITCFGDTDRAVLMGGLLFYPGVRDPERDATPAQQAPMPEGGG